MRDESLLAALEAKAKGRAVVRNISPSETLYGQAMIKIIELQGELQFQRDDNQRLKEKLLRHQ